MWRDKGLIGTVVFLALAGVSVLMTGSAAAEPNKPADDGVAVDWVGSGENKDYQPKSDSEGASWTFDPSKVSLNQGASASGTNFKGARILAGGTDVQVNGDILPGTYDDINHERYLYWEGATLYLGVKDPGSKVSVDAIVEFYWFESSIPRGSDFYVMLLKVKSSPNPWDNWKVVKEPTSGFLAKIFLFWQDIQPAQHVSVFMEPGGAHGSLRWDFSVPFETYQWEPLQVMQITESYGAGFEMGAGSGGGSESDDDEGESKGTSLFSEGGAIGDLTAGVTIQSKGYVNESFKIESQYTMTLYRWMMLVQSGGQDMHYKLVALPHENKEKDTNSESAYYEYFVVMQAARGEPVHIEDIEIGGMFKRVLPFWPDNFKGLSAVATDIWITPPKGVCLPGDIPPAKACNQKGVCGTVAPKCSQGNNQWYCPVVDTYEAGSELTCDGLDNDCDGQVDEWLTQTCSTACGTGKETCSNGQFQGCTAPQPKSEICDGVDNDCDGQTDEDSNVPCESACGKSYRTCQNGVLSSCGAVVATAEVCDGVDNDCDGQTDEGLTRKCSTACGVGTEVCSGGVYNACTAPPVVPETCDGLDNDCDGQVDEALAKECSTACGKGYETCSDGSYKACDAPQPSPEMCGDLLDNDCDGVVDNGCPVAAPPVGNSGPGNGGSTPITVGPGPSPSYTQAPVADGCNISTLGGPLSQNAAIPLMGVLLGLVALRRRRSSV